MSPEKGEILDAYRKFEQAVEDLDDNQSALRSHASRLEQELGEIRHRLATALESMPNGVAFVDSKGKLLESNSSLEHMGLGTGGDRPEIQRLLGQCEQGTGRVRLVLDVVDGTTEVAAAVVPVDDGTGTRMLVVKKP